MFIYIFSVSVLSLASWAPELPFWLTQIISYDSQPIFHQQSTDIPPTIETVLTECWLVYWQKPILGQHIGQHVGWHSVKRWPTCQPRCQLIHQLIYQPTVNWYGNWESADMAVDMSTKWWPIESTNTRPWGAQITQDLEFSIVPYSFGSTKRSLRDFPL